MTDPRITYVPRDTATPQTEISALTDAYRFILDSAKKEATRPGGPDDPRKDKDARTYSYST